MKEEICCECGGTILFGLKAHTAKVTTYTKHGKHERILTRCEHCSIEHARDLWDEEDQGPFPFQQHPGGGRA